MTFVAIVRIKSLRGARKMRRLILFPFRRMATVMNILVFTPL